MNLVKPTQTLPRSALGLVALAAIATATTGMASAAAAAPAPRSQAGHVRQAVSSTCTNGFTVQNSTPRTFQPVASLNMKQGPAGPFSPGMTEDFEVPDQCHVDPTGTGAEYFNMYAVDGSYLGAMELDFDVDSFDSSYGVNVRTWNQQGAPTVTKGRQDNTPWSRELSVDRDNDGVYHLVASQ